MMVLDNVCSCYEPEILAYHEHTPYLKFYIVFKFEAQDLMQLNTHTHMHPHMHAHREHLLCNKKYSKSAIFIDNFHTL